MRVRRMSRAQAMSRAPIARIGQLPAMGHTYRQDLQESLAWVCCLRQYYVNSQGARTTGRHFANTGSAAPAVAGDGPSLVMNALPMK